MKVWCAAIIFLLTSTGPARAQTPCVGRASVITDDTIAFLVQAPQGWILDCNAAKNQGPLTALYRENESWRTGKAVMYVSTLTDRSRHPASFSRRVDAEVAAWRGGAPDVRVSVLPSLVTGRGTGVRAAVRQFQSPAEQLFEIVAYVPRSRIMPILVMTARSDTTFNAALPAFRLLVKSYDPATMKIVP